MTEKLTKERFNEMQEDYARVGGFPAKPIYWHTDIGKLINYVKELQRLLQAEKDKHKADAERIVEMRKEMKKTFTGWIGKSTTNFNNFYFSERLSTDRLAIPEIHKTKGEKADWFDGDWPPVKVKITIEVMK